MNSMVHRKFCLILLSSLLLHGVCVSRAYGVDVSDWSGSIPEELWKFFHQHKTKPIVIINAEGVLWPADILKRFAKYLDAQPHIRRILIKNRTITEALSITEELSQKCKKNQEACLEWAATLFKDIRERVVFQWTRSFWDNLTRTVYIKAVGKLVASFQSQHFPVWVISTSPKWVAEIGSLMYNIGPGQIISTKPILHSDIITERISYPVPYLIQKVFLANSIIKSRPFIVIGHAYSDFDMLTQSTSLSIVINPPKTQTNRNNLPFITAAKNLGWHIQNFSTVSY